LEKRDKKINILIRILIDLRYFTHLITIDDFLLTSTKEQEHLMEVFELRNRKKYLILCSQVSSSEWHKKLGGGAIADSILDRACSKSYKLILSGNGKRDLCDIVNRVFMVI